MDNHWQKVGGVKKRHGIALPLSALRTSTSSGIGEYLDLIPIIDWCADLGLDLIQLLPLNDSGTDPSPYSALSALALHPIYLSLPTTLPVLPTDRVAYEEVRLAKESYFKAYPPEVDTTTFAKNNPWVRPYALFKILREEHAHTMWTEWPAEHQQPSDALYTQYDQEITHQIALQALCHQQLSQVKAYADKKGILLMGDIPILLSPNSADVWLEPHNFDLTHTVGSPPDQYSSEGQNWGFPLFNWENIEKDNFTWWRRRLQLAEQYYHLYRIDHIAGLFHFWAIPPGKCGKEGRYIPEPQEEYLKLGKRLLTKMLDATTMLPIGEDLGPIPPDLRAAMRELGVCGTKVMRWERKWEGDQSFIPIDQYIKESLTCISTHDSEPVQLWWEMHPDEAKQLAKQKNWTYTPQMSTDQLRSILYDSHHTASLFAVNPLQEYLALFPTLVRSPAAERINIPGTSSPSNWTYRFLPSVEDITTHDKLKKSIQELIK